VGVSRAFELGRRVVLAAVFGLVGVGGCRHPSPGVPVPEPSRPALPEAEDLEGTFDDTPENHLDPSVLREMATQWDDTRKLGVVFRRAMTADVVVRCIDLPWYTHEIGALAVRRSPEATSYEAFVLRPEADVRFLEIAPATDGPKVEAVKVFETTASIDEELADAVIAAWRESLRSVSETRQRSVKDRELYEFAINEAGRTTEGSTWTPTPSTRPGALARLCDLIARHIYAEPAERPRIREKILRLARRLAPARASAGSTNGVAGHPGALTPPSPALRAGEGEPSH
jgi:hypothetical protein